MVRTKPAKRKNENASDFKRIKRKLGKKAPPPSNAVNTSFKTRSIQVREQSVVADKAGALVSAKNLTVPELLAKIKHHNSKVRSEALMGLVDVISTFGFVPEVKPQLSNIVNCTIEAVNDEEKSVRLAAHEVIRVLLGRNTLVMEAEEGGNSDDVHWFSPFFRLVMFHICAGLSSLSISRRLDASTLLLLLLDYFPDQIAEFEMSLVPLYSALLVSTLGQLGTGAAATASTSTNSGAKFGTTQSEAHDVVVGVSRRTGGILHHFKKKNAPQKKPKQVTPSATGAGIKVGTSSNTGASDPSSILQQGSSWAKASFAFLRLMHLFKSHSIGQTQNGRDSIQTVGSTTIGFRVFQPLSVVKAVHEQQDSSDAGLDSSSRDEKIFASYVAAIPSATSLWTHAHSAHVSASVGVSATSPDHALSTLQHLESASELVFLLIERSCEFAAELSENIVSQYTVVFDKALEAFAELFPFKTMSRNVGGRTKGGSRGKGSFFRQTHAAELQVNMWICQTALQVSLADITSEARADLVNKCLNSIVLWLLTELQTTLLVDDENDAMVEYPLAEFYAIVEKAWANPRIAETAKAKLNSTVHDFFSSWVAAGCTGSNNAESIKSFGPFLDCMRRFIHECLGNEGAEQSHEISPEWVLSLPRIAWQACRDISTLHVGDVCFKILSECALAFHETEEFWERVARWLTPLLCIQSKSTQENMFGPFITGIPNKMRFQILDLLGVIPLLQLPQTLLRAVVLCTEYLQVYPETCQFEDTRELLRARLIQIPFLVLNRSAKANIAQKQLCTESLADVISFSVSLIWGSSSQEVNDKSTENTNCLLLDGLRTVDQICSQLSGLQKEERIPVAQLMYPLLFQLLKQITTKASSESNNLSLGLVATLFEQQVHIGKSESIYASIDARRILYIARTCLLLQADESYDTFPDFFIHTAMLVVAFLRSAAVDPNERRVIDNLLNELVRIVEPVLLAPSVLLCFKSKLLDAKAKELVLQGWVATIQHQPILQPLHTPACLQLVQMLKKQRSDDSISQILSDLSPALRVGRDASKSLVK